MKILGIDSSARSASAAITDGEKVLGCFYTNTGLTHSQTLMPMIESLLKNANVRLDDIDLIAVNKGPGSFTGIRIGVAAAKGMADVRKLPVYGASTLCSMAYYALFDITDGKITRLTEDNADSIENVEKKLKEYKKIKFIVGDGAEICYNNLKNIDDVRLASQTHRFQSAVGVCFEAMNAPEDQYIESAMLVPEYLRLPQAERELNKKLRKGE